MLADQWALSDPVVLGASEAWSQSRGEGVVVAVLDSGVQVDHPDLAASLWTNGAEQPGNGIDDDANGVVDDIHGANILNGGANIGDDEGHGTHVAGIIAAQGANGIGGAGLAPGAKLMIVKVLDANRVGTSSTLADGIRYAVNEGAQILNVSLNGEATTEELDDALRYAGEHGATIVAAAGNNSRDIDARPSYPASSPAASVLTVTATGQQANLMSFANRGLQSVDLAAPGSQILSTARGSRYEQRAGTSMAAPYAAGALALLAAARPDLAQADLRAALLSSARRSGALAGLIGAGQLNVGAAMHQLLPGGAWHVRAGARAAASASAPARTQARLRLRTGRSARAGRRSQLRWTAKGAANVTRWRVSLDGRTAAKLSQTHTRVLHKRIARAGQHRWKVVGYDATNTRIVSGTRSFQVLRRR